MGTAKCAEMLKAPQHLKAVMPHPDIHCYQALVDTVMKFHVPKYKARSPE
jgi:hypothetical protein